MRLDFDLLVNIQVLFVLVRVVLRFSLETLATVTRYCKLSITVNLSERK